MWLTRSEILKLKDATDSTQISKSCLLDINHFTSGNERMAIDRSPLLAELIRSGADVIRNFIILAPLSSSSWL
jgi:hypothetical protein